MVFMSFIRRNWTPEEADKWTREDIIAIVISPFAYAFLMIGVALSLFLFLSGFIFLLAGIILTGIMHWIIDPKLKAISSEYEKKQREYIENLEKIVSWRE